MTYRTILVHCDSSATVGQRLNVAAELTKRFGANLVGLHARAPFDEPAYFDIGLPFKPLYEAYEKGLDADQATAEAAFGSAVKGKHLATEWRVLDGHPEDELATSGRYADLLVVGQADRGQHHAHARQPARIDGVRDGPARAGGPAGRRRQAARQDRHAVLERQPRKAPGRRPTRCRSSRPPSR